MSSCLHVIMNQANHAIWQKSSRWSTSIVLTVFPRILEWMPPKKKFCDTERLNFFKGISNNLELLSFQKMYGFWGLLLKAKALEPINAGRVPEGGSEGGWYLNPTNRIINYGVWISNTDLLERLSSKTILGSWDLRNGTPRVGCTWTDECLDVVIYSWTDQNPINIESSLTFESNAFP